MGYKVSFLDNQEVSAADLNAIGAGMPSVSYTQFVDGTTYGVKALNEITKSLMNPGVAKNYPEDVLTSSQKECYVTKSGTSTVHISAGRAFFECGATITVDSSGIDLTIPQSDTMQYVYFFYSANGNIAGAKIAETKAESDTVELATISAQGVLTDTRQYAYCKNASILPNQYQTITQSVPVATSGTQTIALPAGFKKFVILRKMSSTTYGEIVFLDCEGLAWYNWSGTYGVTYKTSASNPTSIVRGTNVAYDSEHHSLIFTPSTNPFDFNVEINCM